jgi:hypothetical protein
MKKLSSWAAGLLLVALMLGVFGVMSCKTPVGTNPGDNLVDNVPLVAPTFQETTVDAEPNGTAVFTLTNNADAYPTGTKFLVYADEIDTTVHETVTASRSGGTLTLTSSAGSLGEGSLTSFAIAAIPSNGKNESDRTGVKVNEYVAPGTSRAPVFHKDTWMKTKRNNGIAEFQLTNWESFADFDNTDFFVYESATATTKHATVTAVAKYEEGGESVTGMSLKLPLLDPFALLTLTDSTGAIAAGDYYIAAFEPGDDITLESRRVKLTLLPDAWENHPYKDDANWELKHAFEIFGQDNYARFPASGWNVVNVLDSGSLLPVGGQGFLTGYPDCSVITIVGTKPSSLTTDPVIGKVTGNAQQNQLEMGYDADYYKEVTIGGVTGYTFSFLITDVKSVINPENPGQIAWAIWDDSKDVLGMWIYYNLDTSKTEGTAAPWFTATKKAKDDDLQTPVDFTLTAEPEAGTTFKVYTAVSGGSVHTAVEAVWTTGTTLSLAAIGSGTDVPAGKYYITAILAPRDESRRVELEVLDPYDPPAPIYGDDALLYTWPFAGLDDINPFPIQEVGDGNNFIKFRMRAYMDREDGTGLLPNWNADGDESLNGADDGGYRKSDGTIEDGVIEEGTVIVMVIATEKTGNIGGIGNPSWSHNLPLTLDPDAKVYECYGITGKVVMIPLIDVVPYMRWGGDFAISLGNGKDQQLLAMWIYGPGWHD